MCLILTLQGVFLDFCLINCYISQWIFLIDMKPLQALKLEFRQSLYLILDESDAGKMSKKIIEKKCQN